MVQINNLIERIKATIQWPTPENDPSESVASLCDKCSTVDFHKFFDLNNTSNDEPIWTLQESRRAAKYCPFCQLLSNAFAWSDATSNLTEGTITMGYVSQLPDKNLTWQPKELAFSMRDLSYDAVQYYILLCADENLPSGEDIQYARPVNTDFLDLELARQWIATCDTRHGDACKPSASMGGLEKPLGLRLVDVQEMCIISNATADYIALSYVWGQVPQPQLRTSTEHSWAIPGALKSVNLPRTITEAMILVRHLEKRYLWVDSLCIVQDNAAEKGTQIERMHAIYRAAWLTLVAAAGDSSKAGLPGVRGHPRTSNHQHVVQIQGLRMATVHRNPFEDIASTYWNSRAWTYQEKLCSSRTLVFTHKHAVFWCARAAWREDIPLEHVDRPRRGLDEYFNPLTDLLTPAPGTAGPEATCRVFDSRFGHTLWTYLQRRMSYEEDMLAAFAGIAHLFAGRLGEFHYGLPTGWFNRALCWNHRHVFTRREGFPSWSWAGWFFHHESNSDLYYLSTGLCPVLTVWRMGKDGRELVQIPRDPEDAEATEETEPAKAIHEHFAPPPVDELRDALARPITHAGPAALVFVTSTARLRIGSPWECSREKWEMPSCRGDGLLIGHYPVFDPVTGLELGLIVLDHKWYRTHVASVPAAERLHPFIAILGNKTGISCMLVTLKEENGKDEKGAEHESAWDGDGPLRVERVQMSGSVRWAEWWALNPRKRVVVLE